MIDRFSQIAALTATIALSACTASGLGLPLLGQMAVPNAATSPSVQTYNCYQAGLCQHSVSENCLNPPQKLMDAFDTFSTKLAKQGYHIATMLMWNTSPSQDAFPCLVVYER